MQACDSVLKAQQSRVAIPRRFAIPMRELLMLQPRFNRRSGVKSLSLLQHPRFRAAYDFLLLRAQAGRRGSGAGEVVDRHSSAAAGRAGGAGAGAAAGSPQRKAAPAPRPRGAAAGGAAERRAVSDECALAPRLCGDRQQSRDLRASACSRPCERIAALGAARSLLRSHLYLSRADGAAGSTGFRQCRGRVCSRRLAARNCSATLLDIERGMGRNRRERWGPRIIDLDLIWMVDAAVDEPGLTLPHPGVSTRNFVLYPLADIAPTLEIPGHGHGARI